MVCAVQAASNRFLERKVTSTLLCQVTQQSASVPSFGEEWPVTDENALKPGPCKGDIEPVRTVQKAESSCAYKGEKDDVCLMALVADNRTELHP